MGA
ncbi:hypothetical protein E2320_005674, partial [Naja naja]|jgi:hypothetical protein